MADRISPTPRNKLTGLLADFLGGAYDYAQRPDPTMPMGKANAVLSLLSDALPLKSAATVLDDLSYGQAPTQGAGMTTRLTPEATELALNALPFPRTAGKAALAALGAVDHGALNKAAIVWHGSPHKFDAFDSSKIGTGEGAQAYGHGLYLAESRDVGADYANVLASPRNRVADGKGVYIEPNPMGDGTYMLAKQSEVGQLRGMAADSTQFIYNDKTFPNIASAVKFAKRNGLLAKGERPRLTAIGDERQYIPVGKAADIEDPMYTQFIASDPGNLYKVDLPDNQIARMLDWDKPLSQQAPGVQAAANARLAELRALGGSPPKDPSGEWLHRAFQPQAGEQGFGQSLAADRLRQAGIPGIRYLDGGSRGAGQGSSNFVVFPGEENALTILERNGRSLLD